MTVSQPCKSCNEPVWLGDEHCVACGTALDADQKLDLSIQQELAEAKVSHGLDAARTIPLALAVVYVISGVVSFVAAKAESHEHPVGKLRNLLEGEAYVVLALSLVLALVMLGLRLWTNRSPLGAVLAADAIFVGVILANAVVSPETVMQGIHFKGVVLILLFFGTQAVLTARNLQRQSRPT